MTTLQWILIGAGTLLAFGLTARQVSAEESPVDEPSTTPPASFPPGLIAFAQAIATAEGFWTPGTIPNRAHNPGDLKLGGSTLGEGITVYDDDDQGWAALYGQLDRIARNRSRYYEPSMTIAQMSRVWVGDAPGAANWARNVADALGVSVDVPISNWLIG